MNKQTQDDMVPAGTGQLLTFQLGEETYGVDILRVKEIRGWSPVTKIPRSPEHVLGVLNLRGAIVPVFDLRQRFALAGVAPTATRVIIVLSLKHESRVRECGVLVDSVSDVVDVPPENLKPPPAMGAGTETGFVCGLATVEQRMVILLNVDMLLSQDLADLQPADAAA